MQNELMIKQFDHGLGSIPFDVAVRGAVNGTDLRIHGVGSVVCPGVYDASILLSDMPKGFHPSAIATYLLSICCYQVGAEQHGAMNILHMGADGYQTRRTIGFDGGGGGEIVIDGQVERRDRGFAFSGTIEGKADLPDDLTCTSIYIKRITPEKDGMRLNGLGEGSLFRRSGETVSTRIDTVHNLKAERGLSNPLKNPQFRIVSEHGALDGLRYKTTVHSILDGRNSMEHALAMK